MALPRVRLFQYFRFMYDFRQVLFVVGPFFILRQDSLKKVDAFAKLKGGGKFVYLKSAPGLNLRPEQRIKAFD